MKEIVDCIPSKDLRDYLTKHPIVLNTMQMATVVSAFCPERKKIKLFQQLAETTKNASERMLLYTAIKEIKETGSTGETTAETYRSLFHHNGSPLFPFLEICNLPVLYHRGDIVVFHKRRYYVADRPLTDENSDFTDECYLCFDLTAKIECKEDLFAAHEHIHVCRAETASVENLSENEKRTLEIVRKIT